MSNTSEIHLLRDNKGKVILHICSECSTALNKEELLEGRCPDYGHELVWTEETHESKFKFKGNENNHSE